MQSLGLKSLFWGKLWAKLKFWALIIFFTGDKFVLSVSKLQIPALTYFFRARQHWVEMRIFSFPEHFW